MNKMKIAVIGAGAIGGLVAAYLHKAGQNVILVGREDQVAAIKKNGLSISGINGNENFKLKAAARLDQEYDLVIFSTKTQDLEQAYAENCEYLEDCLVLTTQNGVQADNILSVHFERDRMFSSIVMFGATYVKPGEIVYNFKGDWILGSPFVPVNDKLKEIAAIFQNAFSVVVSEHIMGMKYLKLFVNFNNCICALVGKSMQETFADLDMCKLSIRLLKEGVDIVKNAKIELASLPDYPVERIYGLTSMPEDQAAGIMNKVLTGLSKEPLYGSILQSIMRGKPSEIDFINGEVVFLGKQMHRSIVLNERVVEMVHEVEHTKKFFSFEDVKKLLV
ncbi:MAG: ketopantoate reductase family protein [Candidatus Omnitrophica bacterium]|nr:ketopantoate reductase family protein [Candidatus Omnitrophota bacterium]